MSLDQIRERNEARKAAEATGIIGGVREDFDIDYLLRYIDRMGVQLGQAQDEVFELQEWQNTVANRMPEHYEDDIAQEAIIDRWLDDLTDGSLIREARATELEAAADDAESADRGPIDRDSGGHADWLHRRAAAIRDGAQ